MKALTAREFGEISFELKHELSASLKRQGATVSLRGRDLPGIMKHHANKDWLALLEVMDNREYDEFPMGQGIANAAADLKLRPRHIYVETRLTASYPKRLFLIRACPKGDYFSEKM